MAAEDGLELEAEGVQTIISQLTRPGTCEDVADSLPEHNRLARPTFFESRLGIQGKHSPNHGTNNNGTTVPTQSSAQNITFGCGEGCG